MHSALLLTAIRRGWWLALLCAGVGAGGGAVAAATAPPLWTAGTTLGVTGPNVQDTKTGALVTEMAAKSAADLVDDPAFLAEGLAGRRGVTAVEASVPFGSSSVVIAVTATSRDQARAAAASLSLQMIDQVTAVASHVALSSTRQRVPMELNVRLSRVDPVVVPAAPGSPVAGFSALAGALAGAGLGFALSVLREVLRLPVIRRAGAHRSAALREPGLRRSACDVPRTEITATRLMSAREGHRAC